MSKNIAKEPKRSSLAVASSVPYFTKRGAVPGFRKEPHLQKSNMVPEISSTRRLHRGAHPHILDSSTLAAVNNIKRQIKLNLTAVRELQKRELSSLREQVTSVRETHIETLSKLKEEEQRRKDEIHQKYKHVCDKNCARNGCLGETNSMLINQKPSAMDSIALINQFCRTLKDIKKQFDGLQAVGDTQLRSQDFKRSCLEVRRLEETLRKVYRRNALLNCSEQYRSFYESIIKTTEQYGIGMLEDTMVQELVAEPSRESPQSFSRWHTRQEPKQTRTSRNTVNKESGLTTRMPSIVQMRSLKRTSGQKVVESIDRRVSKGQQKYYSKQPPNKPILANRKSPSLLRGLEQQELRNRASEMRLSVAPPNSKRRSRQQEQQKDKKNSNDSETTKLLARRYKRRINRFYQEQEAQDLIQDLSRKGLRPRKENWLSKELNLFLSKEEPNQLFDRDRQTDSEPDGSCKAILKQEDTNIPKHRGRNRITRLDNSVIGDFSLVKGPASRKRGPFIDPHQSVPLLKAKIHQILKCQNSPKELSCIAQFFQITQERLKIKQSDADRALESCLSFVGTWDWVQQIQFDQPVSDILILPHQYRGARLGQPALLIKDEDQIHEPMQYSYSIKKSIADEKQQTRKKGFAEESTLFCRKQQVNTQNQELGQSDLQ